MAMSHYPGDRNTNFFRSLDPENLIVKWLRSKAFSSVRLSRFSELQPLSPITTQSLSTGRREGFEITTIKTVFLVLLVLPLLLILQTPLLAQPLFEVQRDSFCRNIQRNEPADPFLGAVRVIKGEPVFLWMEILAGERALTMLESKQQMPIYHAWGTEIGVTDVIDIGVTKERWLELREAIRNEMKQRGFFTWRTYSAKRNFREGRWYVSVLDANKRPVRKVGSGMEAFRPEIVIHLIP